MADAVQQSTDAPRPGNASTIEYIVQRLEEEIVLGRLRPRQRLLEEELTEYFGTKRHNVRAALMELESMGIVVRQPNRGAAVRDFTVQEVEQIYEVRELLETHAARITPLPASPECIAELKLVQARHGKAADEHDTRTVFRSNLEFHRTLFAACGNPYLAEQISQLASRAHAIRFHVITDSTHLQRARREHEEMIECLQSGDRARFIELVSGHLRPSKEAYLRLASSLGDNPFI